MCAPVLKIGDVVWLRSSDEGPRMTVIGLVTKDTAPVAWFDNDNRLNTALLAVEALEVDEEIR
jgi:uncharacterized protein YodC (DUF2158 family)